jgi:hypothetical protein
VSIGEIKTPAPGALLLAALWREDFPAESWRGALNIFGNVLCESEVFNFDFSDYYAPEMGEKLKKQFFVFDRLFDPAELPHWKLTAIEIENRFKENNRRRINLDPGYIEAAKLVLSTTKNFDHRIYLGKGVYGDVQLRFRHGHFVTNEWTYTDYKRPEHVAFFEMARGKYRERLMQVQSQTDEPHL